MLNYSSDSIKYSPNSIYYHCTFNAYLPSILREGLGDSPHRNWDFSTGDVCLHIYPSTAESFCESAEEVSDEVFDSGIVILEIDMTGLEDLLDYDPNLTDNYHYSGYDTNAFVYSDIIPPERIIRVMG